MLGRQLAEKLGLSFTDLDDHIERAIGLSIPEIFEKKGELFFRKEEHAQLKSLLGSEKSLVLSLGGGTPAYAGNMELVTRNTPNSFYLQHSIPSLVSRLEGERAHRPLIAHLPPEELYEFIGKHLFDRVPYYTQATHTVFCDGKSAEEILGEIKTALV